MNNAGSRYAINLYLCFALLGIGLLVIGYGIDMYSPSYSWRNVDYSPSDPVIPLEIFICAGVAIILYSLPAFIILMKKCFNCKNYSYYMTATEFCEQCSNTVKHIPLDKIKYVTKDKQTFNGYSYPVIKIGTSDKEILVEYIGSINRSIKIISETMSKM